MNTNNEKRRLISELAPSPHLEAADLEDDTVVTIKSWERHEVGPDKVIKGVIYFEEMERGFVINKTNRVILQALFGRYVEDMIGKQITIYPTECQFEGKMVPCLRIKNKHPAAAKPQLAKTEKVA